MKIALAGNPNSGKTTLFNALTGSNQFVGNWPGVTVEKKEGKLKKREGVSVIDLPGIYSLSPYTLEEVVARDYLTSERPDVILNIVDANNLERNLYLTTQLIELGIPVVIALNMMDVVKKRKDKIDVSELSRRLGCKIVEISALKGDGVTEAADAAIKAAEKGKTVPQHSFSGEVEHTIAHIEEAVLHNLPDNEQRYYAIKIFERDAKIIEKLKISSEKLQHIEEDIAKTEKSLDDDAESIITGERYVLIGELLKGVYVKKQAGQLTTSDKIDKIVTNRWLALPIFIAVMFLVYFVSVTTVGTWLTDWTNDNLFGDGFHLLGIGQSKYETAVEDYSGNIEIVNGYIEYLDGEGVDVSAITELLEAEEIDNDAVKAELESLIAANPIDGDFEYSVVDEETMQKDTVSASFEDLQTAVASLNESDFGYAEPPADEFGVWVPGIPVLIENLLVSINCADWLQGLILDGIVAGVGAVLGFVPQMLVLFIFLAILEDCGYMARIAFVLDRIFRKFGLSGKSFIPMLIGTGCGVPGIMASRTIENDRDRKMTITVTTFIPCGAKLPFIAMIAGAIFGGAWWVAPFAYFLGMAAIIVSGILLKKTKGFSGDPAPFVMELPEYHFPTFKNVMRSMWERGWSFIKKAGTIILLSTIVIWFLTFFGFANGSFGMLTEDQIDCSILSYIGRGIAWIFAPIGWGNWEAAVASVTGLVAKENIVGTMGILYGGSETYANLATAFTSASGLSFLIFNLLCAPCFAAIGAIKREMNNAKWTWFAIGYQTIFAYVIAMIAYNVVGLFTGVISGIGWLGFAVAILLLAGLVFMVWRPDLKKKGNN